jgi:hypothetical protein
MLRRSLQLGSRAGIVALAVAAGVTLVSAQQASPAGDPTRAIQELTGEIRNLRAAVTHSTELQLQGQILGLYLSLQQSRVAQATARLDAVRRELEAAATRTRQHTEIVADLEARIHQETDAERRRKLEMEYRAMKQHAERLAVQEQQIRNREAEILQSAQTEEARWNELVAKLEQLLRK